MDWNPTTILLFKLCSESCAIMGYHWLVFLGSHVITPTGYADNLQLLSPTAARPSHSECFIWWIGPMIAAADGELVVLAFGRRYITVHTYQFRAALLMSLHTQNRICQTCGRFLYTPPLPIPAHICQMCYYVFVVTSLPDPIIQFPFLDYQPNRNSPNILSHFTPAGSHASQASTSIESSNFTGNLM